MFDSLFAEGQTQAATFPEDDLDAFKALLGWVYQGKVELPIKGNTTPPWQQFVRLIILGEKFRAMELVDEALERYI